MEFLLSLPVLLLIVVVVFGFKSFIVVPQQEVYVVERLGRFHKALTAGLNILIPFIDRVAYRHSLKEIPLDVPSQVSNIHLQIPQKECFKTALFSVGQTFRPPAHDFLCRRHPVGRRANHLRTLPRHAGRIERGRRICRRIGIFIFGVEKEIN